MSLGTVVPQDRAGVGFLTMCYASMIIVWQVLISGTCWVGVTIECVGDLTSKAVDLVSSGGIRHKLLSRFINFVASDTMQLLANSESWRLGARFKSFSVINSRQ